MQQCPRSESPPLDISLRPLRGFPPGDVGDVSANRALRFIRVRVISPGLAAQDRAGLGTQKHHYRAVWIQESAARWQALLCESPSLEG
jgi:hypothetical protein